MSRKIQVSLKADNGNWVGRCYGCTSGIPDENNGWVHVPNSPTPTPEGVPHAIFNIIQTGKETTDKKKIIKFQVDIGLYLISNTDRTNINEDPGNNSAEFAVVPLSNGKHAFKSISINKYLQRNIDSNALIPDATDINATAAQFELLIHGTID